MAIEKRRRTNALNDFQTPDFSKATENQTASPRDPATASLMPATTRRSERIERLHPSEMIPDRFQPRRLLPFTLRQRFFSGEINCYQAAAEWLALAEQDPLMRTGVERLLQMGSSFETHGQIKPITGSWQTQPNGELRFQIETGERRFWAACLQHASNGGAKEPLLRVEVIENPTRQRQVLENRHAEPPSAVGQACEIAALILSEIGILPDPAVTDEYDYFRQARAQRMPAGLWEKLTPTMQLTRPRMVQLLNILRLPTPLLELADHYRLSERVLREVLGSPKNTWESMIRQSGEESLTSDDILLIKQTARPDTTLVVRQALDERTKAYRDLRHFQRVLSELPSNQTRQVLDALANDLTLTGENDALIPLLDELLRLLRIRLDS